LFGLIFRRIDDRGHPVVRADLQERGVELVALADIDRNDAVREPGLLQHDMDLVAVRRRPGVKLDHRFGSPRSV
jgi:hypothetical protein